MPPRLSDTEAGDDVRLDALRRLDLLDAPKQAAFERVTRLVRHTLGVPTALLTLIDADRQFFLSEQGLAEPYAAARESPLTHSFCRFVIGSGEMLRVEDTRQSAYRDNPGIEALGVGAYLGMPLLSIDGIALGALCAIDGVKRVWTAADASALADLAAMASTEIALRELASKLEERIRTETAARHSAQEELARKRRLEVLGQLAGGVAHDFANVLQAVQGGVRMASNHLERDPARARRLLEAVGDAARRGGSVTRRLLGFARRGELRVDRVSVPAVFTDLQEVLQHTLNRPGLTVHLEVEPGLPAVTADQGELETVLVNLATNARDAMGQGGRLVFSASAEHVDEAHAAGLLRGHYVRLAAADTGSGMDADTLARASEPFFTTKPEGEGTGLGLAMARDFALQAGGGFALASEVGVGTTVTLWLPVAEAAAEQMA